MAIFYKRSSVDTIDKSTFQNALTVPNVDGIWSWFGDPRAIYYNGNTYIGIVDSSGNVVIIKYNHSTRTQTTFTLHATLEIDDHNNPSILILPNGKLICFYTAHASGSMFYRISTIAEDISAWGNEQTISGISNGAYPHPVQLSGESNRIYLFYRELDAGTHHPRSYVTSDDNGETWSSEKLYLDLADERPYVKITSNNIDKIHFTWTDAHPNEITNNNVYHAYYTNGNFYKSDGTLIKSIAQLPMAPSDATKVYDSVASGKKAWVWDIVLDSNGYPVIAYTDFVSTTNHRYRYARWTGSAWVDNEVMPAGPYLYSGEAYYSGGICIDQNNPSIIFLSIYLNGKREIAKLTTSNSGVDWKLERITQDSPQINCRPYSIVNHTNDFPILWWKGTYSTYTSYNTKIYSTKLI